MFQTKRIHGVLFITIFSGFLFSGFANCNHGRMTAAELDKVAESVDKYGFASISAPFLAAPSEVFSFDLNKSASYFYDRASKSTGGVRTLNSASLDAQGAVRINVEQLIATAAQLQQSKTVAEFREKQRKLKRDIAVLQALTSSSETTATDSEDSEEMPNEESTADTSALDSNGSDADPLAQLLAAANALANQEEPSSDALPGFTPNSETPPTGVPIDTLQRLARKAVGDQFTSALNMPNGPFQIPARQALHIADGDVMTQALYRWFTEPAGNKLKNYELFFCPVVVSVQPGYKTREDFQADITVNVDLARPVAGERTGMEYLSSKFGLSDPPIQVAGVFPLIDAQVLDLASSKRRLYSAAFQLSAIGFGTQANFLTDYAEKLESDVQTQNALTAASAYTIGSTSFGFRVQPQLFGVGDQNKLGAGAQRRLQSKSFPAMTVVLVDRAYLETEAEFDSRDLSNPSRNTAMTLGTNRTNSAQSTRLAKSRLRKDEQLIPGQNEVERDKYPYLVLRTSLRWSPVEPHKNDFSEIEMWERARALDDAEKHWKLLAEGNTAVESIDQMGRHERDLLDSRIKALTRVSMDSRSLVRVYHTRPAEQVTISKVLPRTGWLNQATVITITGTGMRRVKSVTVAGIACDFKPISDEQILAIVPAWNKKIQADLTSVAKVPEGDRPFPDLIETALTQVSALTPSTNFMISNSDPRDSNGKESMTDASSKSFVAKLHLGAKIPVKTTCDDTGCDGKSCNTCITFSLSVEDERPDARTSSKDPVSVKLTYDEAGNLTGITAPNNVDSNSLLKIAENALCCSKSGGTCSINVISGGAVVTHCGICGKCESKCKCKD